MNSITWIMIIVIYWYWMKVRHH